jgi:hypothetical protein
MKIHTCINAANAAPCGACQDLYERGEHPLQKQAEAAIRSDERERIAREFEAIKDIASALFVRGLT